MVSADLQWLKVWNNNDDLDDGNTKLYLENKNAKKNNSMDTLSNKLMKLHTISLGYGQEWTTSREKQNLLTAAKNNAIGFLVWFYGTSTSVD